MSFRSRKLVVAQTQTSTLSRDQTAGMPLGVRPSPLDGRRTTSTGTSSLDSFLAGHSGLALGTSLLVEESGTTDFSGTLLKYFAAQGVVHEQEIHVFGMHESWGRELPGVSTSEGRKGNSEERKGNEEKMKIAWRYEKLPEIGRGGRERATPQTSSASMSPFCHEFDLSRRLVLPSPSPIKFVPTFRQPDLDFRDIDTSASPFKPLLSHLTTQLSSLPSNTVHRVVVPSLLSPAFYPAEASRPDHLLQFLHALRALLREYPAQLTAMISLPLTLYPRSNGLTRWMELLSDGVLELASFPSTDVAVKVIPTLSAQEEPPQGMFKIHRLPVFHEKGGGGGDVSGFSDDLAFTLSRKKGLVIKPFSLPPVEADTETQQGGVEHGHGKATKTDIEF